MLELIAAAAIAGCAIPPDVVPAPVLPAEDTRIVPVEHLVLAFYWWPQECRRGDEAGSPGCRAGFGLPDLDRPAATSAGAVRDAMVAANPALPRTAIFVGTDKNQWLTEVRVCLDLAGRPQPCAAGTGAPDSVPLRVWPR